MNGKKPARRPGRRAGFFVSRRRHRRNPSVLEPIDQVEQACYLPRLIPRRLRDGDQDAGVLELLKSLVDGGFGPVGHRGRDGRGEFRIGSKLN